jgi:hypothetical protein
MKVPGVEFACPQCSGWSEDDSICSLCGAEIPPEPDADALFIPGYESMTKEERLEAEAKAREALRKFREENKGSSAD